MDKLKELVDLCKLRQGLFKADSMGFETLFNTYNIDENFNQLTIRINRLASSLSIYDISFYEHSDSIAVSFCSLEALKKITGDVDLNEKPTETDDQLYRYSYTFFDGALTLIAFEKEEHKKAQAI